jgi:hypothetical protein
MKVMKRILFFLLGSSGVSTQDLVLLLGKRSTNSAMPQPERTNFKDLRRHY